jgi:hypothetical protein
MRRFAEIVGKTYAAGLAASPVIGANYNVWTHYEPKYGYTAGDFAIDSVSGAFCGIVLGFLSPVVALGIPAYVAMNLDNSVARSPK